jgi:FkbM family methyltransferase
MPSLQSKQIRLGLNQAIIYGLSDDDRYFQEAVIDHMEPEFQLITTALIPIDSVCIDIGANIGLKTFVMAKQAKDGVVLAVEGSPHVYEALCMNITNNKLDNVRAENAAVTDTTTTVRFVENSAWGHMAESINPAAGTEVPGVTLENLLDKLPATQKAKGVRFVKIDTEGHEYKILTNAAPVLKQDNPWIYFEFNSFCLSAFGDTNPKELLKFILSNFKYVFRVEKQWLNTGQALLRIFDFTDWLTLLHENIVCNGSVDDFLVTNRESALHEVRHLLLPSSFLNQNMILQKKNTENQSQLETYKTLLKAVYSSHSWRWTAPLRAIVHRLRKCIYSLIRIKSGLM